MIKFLNYFQNYKNSSYLNLNDLLALSPFVDFHRIRQQVYFRTKNEHACLHCLF